MESYDLFIYVDGACSGNPGSGGWAFVAIDKDSSVVVKYGKSSGKTTNNAMELTAIIKALEYSRKVNKRPIIFTDSEYASKSFNNRWYLSWDSSRPNYNLWVDLVTLANKTNARIEYLAKDEKNKFSIMADKLAKKMAKSGK